MIDFISEVNNTKSEANDNIGTISLMVNEFAAPVKPDLKIASFIGNNSIKGYRNFAKQLTIDELVDTINNGHTIMPALFDLEDNAKLSTATFVSQQIFAVDIDETTMNLEQLLKAVPYEPTIIYNTFSHTEKTPHYRVVFITKAEDAVTDSNRALAITNHLIHSTPGADGQCKDIRRRFYAGKVVYVNKESVFNPSNIPTEELEQEIIYNNEHKINRTHTVDLSNLSDIVRTNLMNPEIQQIYGNRIVKTTAEIENIVYRIPLQLVLGIDTKNGQLFNCILGTHEDKKPSANISATLKKGYYFYKCFSCCKEVLYITDFVPMEEILEILNIRTIWYENNKEAVDYNIKLLSDLSSIESKYPATYEVLNICKRDYLALLLRANNILNRQGRAFSSYTDNIIVSVKNSIIANELKCSKDTVRKHLIKLVDATIIVNITDEMLKDIDMNLYMSNEKQKEKTYYKTQNSYFIKKLNTMALGQAEKILIDRKQSGATSLGVSKEQSKATGSTANNKATTTDKDIATRDLLWTWFERTYKRNGVVVKAKYLKYAEKNGIDERKASTYIAGFNNQLGLTIDKVNKKYKEMYPVLKSTPMNSRIFIKK